MTEQTRASDFMRATCVLTIASICLLESASAQDEVTYLESYCSDDGHYNQGSKFQNNLGLLLSNLTTKATDYKYYNFTAGDVTDRVYGLFLCNRGFTNQVCQDCVLIAKGEIQRSCSSSKVAVIWYSQCMLRYANYNIFSACDVSKEYYLAGGPKKYSEFNQDLIDIFISLSQQATSGNNSTLWAATVLSLTKYVSVSCYVDCTPDLSLSDCGRCLQTGVGKIMFEGTQGGVVLQPSCRLMYRFADDDDDGFHPTGKGIYVALGIVSLTAAASLLLNVVVCLRRTKITGKPTGTTRGGNEPN